MSSKRLIISVYKSSKKAEMYVYLEKKKGVASIPEDLLTFFGTPIHVFDMLLTEDKKLARVDTEKVLSDIADKGYFLQMPPVEDNHMPGIVEYKRNLNESPDDE